MGGLAGTKGGWEEAGWAGAEAAWGWRGGWAVRVGVWAGLGGLVGGAALLVLLAALASAVRERRLERQRARFLHSRMRQFLLRPEDQPDEEPNTANEMDQDALPKDPPDV